MQTEAHTIQHKAVVMSLRPVKWGKGLVKGEVRVCTSECVAQECKHIMELLGRPLWEADLNLRN